MRIKAANAHAAGESLNVVTLDLANAKTAELAAEIRAKTAPSIPMNSPARDALPLLHKGGSIRSAVTDPTS
jgi:hypothetical protein